MANDAGADDVIRITIDGKTHSINPDDLELGEIEVIEDAVDRPIGDVDFGRIKAVRALVYVIMHRDDPSFTMDDARSMRSGALSWDEPEPEPEPEPESKTNGARPTQRAAKPASKVATDA